MTTKVVKGSMWTLAGSVLPLAVSFISTPFIIRFLGAESYGVLLLVGLIPTYFSFADFGMGIASTKYASEAFGQGDRQKEAQVVWTAAAIALIASSIVAIPVFLFSYPIVRALNVPEHLLTQASIALRIAAAAFVLGILGSVVNSPMLSRLRMDFNTVTQAAPKILLAAITPFILYFGGGIVGAVSWAFVVAAATFVGVLYFSSRLLTELPQPQFNRRLLRPLITFGGAWIVGAFAAVLLVNFEKLVLTRMVSVQALAYYSVAFTFANTATMFAQAMIQSLIPAFAQLLGPERRAEFGALFERGMRLNLMLLLPGLMLMVVIARPFFTLWAGEDFGRESVVPFYILSVGLFFNIAAYLPYSALIARGRTDLFAKLYWVELALYAVAAVVLISYFGIMGAAIAWAFRVLLDTFFVFELARRNDCVDLDSIRSALKLGLAGSALVLPVLMIAFSITGVWLFIAVPICLAAYFAIVWRRFVFADEKKWFLGKVRGLVHA